MTLRTRFAPSPTGYLHLGHAVHLLYLWGIARALGAEILLRIEDHDRQRCRPEYETALLDDLEWLGLLPNRPALETFRAGASPFRQRDCAARYQQALDRLRAQGLVYGCTCSRAMILRRKGSSVAGELRYDNHCRPGAGVSADPPGGLRVQWEAVPQHFHDALLQKNFVHTPAQQCGDLLLRDRHGQWTYQFCVVVDDLDQDINLIIRGTDLLDSTGRQIQLARMLGRTAPLHFMHHPVLQDAAGRKLSKRDFDGPLHELRAAGHRGEEVLGRAALAAGLQRDPRPLSGKDLGEFMFSIPSLREAIQGFQAGLLSR